MMCPSPRSVSCVVIVSHSSSLCPSANATASVRRRSAKTLGLHTGLDMRNQTLDFMQAHFGKAGAY
jgi:hypothetical protein